MIFWEWKADPNINEKDTRINVVNQSRICVLVTYLSHEHLYSSLPQVAEIAFHWVAHP